MSKINKVIDRISDLYDLYDKTSNTFEIDRIENKIIALNDFLAEIDPTNSCPDCGAARGLNNKLYYVCSCSQY